MSPRWRRHWRWAVVAAGVALLVSLPSLVAARPTDAADIEAADLTVRIAGSAGRPHHGYVEARGALRLPESDFLPEQAALFGETSRMRVWYAGPDAWRVDLLSSTGELDIYRDGPGLAYWASDDQRYWRTSDTPFHLPRASDLTPPELARRIVALADDETLTSIRPARVGGRAVPGVRITPSGAREGVTTIDHVDIWADANTGVALRVRVHAVGIDAAVLESQFLEVSLSRPDGDLVGFEQPPRGRERRRPPFDLIQVISNLNLTTFPRTVAGLPLRGSPAGALAMYGTGFGAVEIVAVPERFVAGVANALAPEGARPWGGSARVVATPLINAMMLTANSTTYFIVGPVLVDELDRIAAALSSGSP